jgi:peptide/nickel transport system substrate-binding protein
VIEYYTDEWELDAEQINTYLGTALWPDYGYGEAGWHVIAIANNAEAAGELAYSAYKSDALDIEHMNILHGNSLGILSAKLEEAAAEGYIPYEPTLSHYITTKEAKARYKNLGQFFQSYNHYWVGTGPYILETVRWDANTLILTHNPDYIDPAGKWLMFNP